jgi:hypothetical protein
MSAFRLPGPSEAGAAVRPVSPAGAYRIDLPGCGHVPISDAPQQMASTILATIKETRA